MPDFPNIQFDRITFWIGFLAASIFWLIVTKFRQWLPSFNNTVKQRNDYAHHIAQSGVENELRQEILNHAQKLHLAHGLFSLDEIIIKPYLMAPWSAYQPIGTLPPDTIIEETIPYLPDFPELSAFYNIPRLDLAQAIQNGMNIVVIGQPGCGKTVTLAYFASLLAKRDPSVILYESYLPLLFHAFDLEITDRNSLDPFDSLYLTVLKKFPKINPKKLRSLLKNSILKGKIILLMDGLDEIPPENLPEYVNYLKSFISEYPNNQIVTTASSDYVDGLLELNFFPLSVSPWNHEETDEFINKWANHWTFLIDQDLNKADEVLERKIIFSSWLTERTFLSPLEWTLLLWGSFAGDLPGNSFPQMLDSCITRLTNGVTSRSLLEKLALEFYKNKNIGLNRAELRGIISEKSISGLVENSLLCEHPNGKYRFIHLFFYAYLASSGLTTSLPEKLPIMPFWSIDTKIFQFLSSKIPMEPLIAELLEREDAPLYPNLLMVARWLRYLPAEVSWRNQILRRLFTLIQRESLPIGIRLRIMAAFVNANDGSINSMLKQMFISPSAPQRFLAAIGAGAIADEKTIPDLTGLLSDPIQEVRHAACLAIGSFHTSGTHHIIKNILLNADETLRQAAAESMAFNKSEGFNTLQEACKSKDPVIRRAAVLGLSLIHEPVVIEVLEKIMAQDNNWVVKNVAGHAVEMLRKPDTRIPQALPRPSDAKWLITFAGKHGISISPNQPVTDLLLMALKTGTSDESLAALNYLKHVNEEGVIAAVYQVIFGDNGYLREIGINTLWWLSISGAKLVPPSKFGFG